MKKLRKISALMLALVLICFLSISAFAINEPTAALDYEFDDIRMWHKIVGYNRKAHAIISFEYLDGTPVPSSYAFSYSGSIDYQYCPEEYMNPRYYEDGRKTDSGSATGSQKIINTGYVPTGYLMIDASMYFTTQFSTTHDDINHSRPDRIYVAIN